MRILFVIRRLGIGGAERQLLELGRGLVRAGHRVHVAVFYAGGELEGALTDAGVDLIALGKRHRWDLLSQVRRLRQAIGTLRPDVVHGYMTGGNLAALAARPRRSGARLVWGVRHSDLRRADTDRLEWLLEHLEPRLARAADVVIANSDLGAGTFVGRGAPAERVQTVANGIDVDRFVPDPVARARVRAELGIPPGALVVGRFGRLDPVKDYETFLAAAALLAADDPGVHFLCVGDGPPAYAATLARRAAPLGERIHWLAARAAVEDLYNACDVCVSSSAYGEGFPNVVAEAMACGVPCVVTDVGDSAAVVGHTGVVVPPGSPGALADGVRRLAAGPAGDRARGRVVANYSVDAMVTRTVELLGR